MHVIAPFSPTIDFYFISALFQLLKTTLIVVVKMNNNDIFYPQDL